MCINLITHTRQTPEGVKTYQFQCHKCWQCQEDRVDDIVGRCIAEQKVSAYTYTVTLTYGGDTRIDGRVSLKARLLDYRDVSKYLKRLRKFVPLRYVACGEYGERNSRGHWHLIIFTNRKIPNLELEKRFIHKGPTINGVTYTFWDEGFSYWEEATYGRMRYVCAYVLKEIGKHGKNSERRYGASRFPPLGFEYFRQLAGQYVSQGLSPQNGMFSFREVKTKDGKLKQFRLTRRSAEKFVQNFIDLWHLKYNNHAWPQSDYIDEYIDQIAKMQLLEPGDWLELRRYMMAKEATSWDGSGSLKNGITGMRDGIVSPISVGMTVDRRVRARARIDDRLVTMGNRKGIGWNDPRNSAPYPMPGSSDTGSDH